MTLTFWLKGHPPSPNRTRRVHWHARSDEANVWKEAAYFSAVQAARETGIADSLPFTKAALRLEFSFKVKRKRDIDNLIASAKPIIDGLVPHVIVDDDSEHLTEISAACQWNGDDGLWVIVEEK